MGKADIEATRVYFSDGNQFIDWKQTCGLCASHLHRCWPMGSVPVPPGRGAGAWDWRGTWDALSQVMVVSMTVLPQWPAWYMKTELKSDFQVGLCLPHSRCTTNSEWWLVTFSRASDVQRTAKALTGKAWLHLRSKGWNRGSENKPREAFVVFRIMETIILDLALKFIIQDNFSVGQFKKKKNLPQIFNPLKHKVHRKQGISNKDLGWSPVSRFPPCQGSIRPTGPLDLDPGVLWEFGCWPEPWLETIRLNEKCKGLKNRWVFLWTSHLESGSYWCSDP